MSLFSAEVYPDPNLKRNKDSLTLGGAAKLMRLPRSLALEIVQRGELGPIFTDSKGVRYVSRLNLEARAAAQQEAIRKSLGKTELFEKMLKLNTFSLEDLCQESMLSKDEILKVLNKRPLDWFEPLATEAAIQENTICKLTPAGIDGLRKITDPFGTNHYRLKLDKPLGLLSARETFDKLISLYPQNKDYYLRDAARNLDWAEAELEDGAFAAIADKLREEIVEFRAKLGPIPDRKRKSRLSLK